MERKSGSPLYGGSGQWRGDSSGTAAERHRTSDRATTTTAHDDRFTTASGRCGQFDGFKFGMTLGPRETGIACFTDP
jgi:hypothetical protein